MPSLARKSFFLCLTLLVSHTSFAKKSRSFRALLNKIHVSASIGYGGAQHSHQVLHTGMGGPENETVVFKEGDHLYLYAGEPGIVYAIRWFDGSYIQMQSYTDWDLAQLKKAKTSLEFAGKSTMLPISLGAHVDLWGKMRLGLGGAFFIHNLKQLMPEKDHEDLGPYIPLQETHYNLRPFVSLGYKFIERPTFSMLLETSLGFDYLYSVIDSGLADYFNLGTKSIGIMLERNISEYLRLFGKLSYERSDCIRGLNEQKLGIVLQREGLLFQVGFSVNYPEVPRCSLPGCEIERKHKHGGKVYRGVSIFTNTDAQGRNIYENNKKY